MKVGGKRPRGRPRLSWLDRVRSDIKEHHFEPKLAQNREAWINAVMAIDHGKESAKVSIYYKNNEKAWLKTWSAEKNK